MARRGSIGVRVATAMWPRCGPSAARRRRLRPALTPGFEALECRAVPSTITVLNTNDSGPDSLRAAITQANLDPAQDTIDFAPSVAGTITLQSALPDLSTAIVLVGPGASALAVARSAAAGTPNFRIFTVDAGARVTISGLAISGGNSASGFGGGIFNAGALTVVNSTLSGNSVGDGLSSSGTGGGIFNAGALTVVNSTISGNSAEGFTFHFGTGRGGGIFNSGTLTVTNSTIIANSGSGSGGGIDSSGTVTVTGSTLSGNNAGSGGGIFNTGTLTVANSTLSGNTAGVVGSGGGGIANEGTLTVDNSTFSGNTAFEGGGIISFGTMTVASSTLSGNTAGDGGGIFNTGTISVANSTLSGNMGSGVGGGIANTGTMTLVNSTLGDNGAGRGGGIFSISGSATSPVKVTAITSLFANPAGGNLVVAAGSQFVSLGHNLFSDAPAVPLDRTDLINTDPRLGPLADNGGPTFTQALLPGSPAIDAGVSVPGVTTDQRGVPRPQGKAPDIGAFELVQAPTVVALERFGFHAQPTILVVAFSGPLDPARAQDLRNYRLVALAGPGRPAHAVGIRSAAYDPAIDSVTLRLAGRLPLHGSSVLTIVGAPPSGLASAMGMPLAGNGSGVPGTDFVRRFGVTALGGPASLASKGIHSRATGRVASGGRPVTAAAVAAPATSGRLSAEAHEARHRAART